MPRAIAYDAETLRSLLDSRSFRRDRARTRPESACSPRQCPRPDLDGNGSSRLRASRSFPSGHLLSAAVRESPVSWVVAVRQRQGVVRTHGDGSAARHRDHAVLTVSTPDGMRTLRAKFIVGCDGGTSRVRDMLGSTARRLDLRAALARRRCASSRVTMSSRSASTATRGALASKCRPLVIASAGNSCVFLASA